MNAQLQPYFKSYAFMWIYKLKTITNTSLDGVLQEVAPLGKNWMSNFNMVTNPEKFDLVCFNIC